MSPRELGPPSMEKRTLQNCADKALPEVLQKDRTGFILQPDELVNAVNRRDDRVYNPDFMECTSMNPLKSIRGTIIAGFVIAIVIALIL